MICIERIASALAESAVRPPCAAMSIVVVMQTNDAADGGWIHGDGSEITGRSPEDAPSAATVGSGPDGTGNPGRPLRSATMCGWPRHVPTRPVAATPERRRRATRGSRRYRRAAMTVRLTVQRDAWERHVAAVASAYDGLVPVVKGNGYGFGRADAGDRGRRASPTRSRSAPSTSSTTSPAGVTPVVLTPTPPTAGAASPDPHRRLGRARPRARTAGRVGCSSSWRRRCAGSARPSTDLGAVTATAPRPPGSTSSGSASTRPSPAPTTSTSTTIDAWLDVLDPDDEVWVSHLSPGAYQRPPRRVAGAALPRPGRHRAVARRQVRAPPRRRRARRADRCAAGEPAGYRQHVVPTRRRARDGRRRDGPRRAPARRRSQPVPLRPPPPGAPRAAAHAHVDGARARPASRAPRSGDVVDVQRPLISIDRRRGPVAVTTTDVRARRHDRDTGPAARARRRAGRRPDRRRRDELPRLPASCAAATRATGRSSTAFFDPWNGPLSTRFAATFVLVAGVGVTLLTRRSRRSGDAAAVRRSPLDARAPRSRAVRRRAAARRDLAGHDPAVLRRHVRGRRRAVHAAQPLGRRRRRRRRGRRRRHRLVGARAARSTATTSTLAVRRPDARHRAACCSTCSSTAPTRCCRGWRSSAPASCSAACLQQPTWWRPVGTRRSGLTLFGVGARRSLAPARPVRGRRAGQHRPVQPRPACTRPARSARRSCAFGAVTWLAEPLRRRGTDPSCCATPAR